MSSTSNPGNKGKLLKQQGEYKTDPYQEARKKIKDAIARNVGKVEAGKTEIKAILDRMLHKPLCPPNVTKPSLSDFDESGTTLNQVQSAAIAFIEKVQKICPFKPGTTVTSVSTTDPAKITIDPELLAGKIIGILGRNKKILEEIRTKIETKTIGNMNVQVGTTKTYDQVLTFFTTRFKILERDTDEARRLIVDLKLADPDTYKKVYEKLKSMYNQLFSYDTTSYKSSEDKGKSLIKWVDSYDAVTSSELKETLDLTSALLTFEAMVEGATPPPTLATPIGPEKKKPILLTNFIDSTVKNNTDFSKILTSIEPYYYFKDDDSSKKGVGRYSLLDFYNKIGAVNGFGFLKLVEYYNNFMVKTKENEKEQFVFESMICKHLFRMPDGKSAIPYPPTADPFKKQLLFLAFIHQIHFIGTLFQTKDIIASENSSAKGSSVSAEEAKRKALCGIRDDAQVDVADLKTYISDLDAEIAIRENELKLARDEFKTIPDVSNLEKASWFNPLKWGVKPQIIVDATKFKEEIKKMEDSISRHITGRDNAERLRKQAKDEVKKTNAKIATIPGKSSISVVQSLLAELEKNRDNYKLYNKAYKDRDIDVNTEIYNLCDKLDDKIAKPNNSGEKMFAVLKSIQLYEKYIKENTSLKNTIESDLELAEADLAKKETACKESGDKKDKVSGSFGQPVPPFSINAEFDSIQKLFVAKYNYARSFILSDEAIKILDIKNIDTWAQDLYKDFRDNTFYLQTFEKMKVQLDKPGGLLPPLPGASSGPAGPAKPGFLTDVAKSAMKEADIEVGVKLTQLSSTIQRTVIAFLHKYTLDSIIDEKKREIMNLKQTKARMDTSMAITDYDDMLRQGLRVLTSKLNGKPELIPIKEEAARIQNLIQEYIRTRS